MAAKHWAMAGMVAASLVAWGAAKADPIPPGWQGDKVEPIGFSGLEGRFGAFKLAIKHGADNRWYLYMGHSFDHGWTILDVTDPTDPKFVRFIPGPSDATTSQVTLNGNLMLTATDRGENPKEGASAVWLWDISEPANPRKLSEWVGGVNGSHRDSYPGGKYAYLATSMPGYEGKVMVILDVSDPLHPVQAGLWSQPGQKQGEPKPKLAPGFHGPANVSPDGKMISTGYTPDVVNLDIADPAHPKLIGSLTMTPPFIYAGAQSVHTVLPLWDRKLLYASSEAMATGCDKDALNFAAFIDNRDPAKPRLTSMFPVPRPPKDAPYKDFCQKGGRFGPHNVSQEIHNPDIQKYGNLMYIAYFNAGLRVFDISDPQLVTETGWFMPPERPDAPPTAGNHASPIEWTEDVAVDARGNIYISEDKWGIFVLRYKGPVPPATAAAK
ncbi:MAG TPA: hypothetical protein VN802_22735 [Stellaceae bacterium]|nr:hypothetical protein [Stellaceae bacterium]